MIFLRPFIFGIIASLGALVFEFALGSFFGNSQSVKELFWTQLDAFIVATVLAEEIFKFFFVYKNYRELTKKVGEHIQGRNAFFGSVAIGAGFALVESFFAFPSLAEIKTVSMLTGIFAVHITTTATMGYFIAKTKAKNFSFFTKALAVAFAIHIAYNGLSIYFAEPWIIFSYTIFLAGILTVMTAGIILKGIKDANY